MKKYFFLFLILAFCEISHAGTIGVYRQSLVVTETGNGGIIRKRSAGWIILDDLLGVTVLNVDKKNKVFQVWMPECEWSFCDGGKGRWFTAIGMTNGAFDGLQVKGRDQPNKHYLPFSDRVPRFFTISGIKHHETHLFADYEWIVEFRGTWRFDCENSEAATMESSFETLNRIRETLFLAGYRQD